VVLRENTGERRQNKGGMERSGKGMAERLDIDKERP
jgi:hypothetical protein